MVRKAKCRDRLVKLCLLRSEGDGVGGGENEWGKSRRRQVMRWEREGAKDGETR